MSNIKCTNCNRSLGENLHQSIKLYGKCVYVMTIQNQTQNIKITCRSCSTDYNLEDGKLKKDDKSTNRKLLDKFSEGRMKKS